MSIVAELIAEAKAIVDRWHTEGMLGPLEGIRSRPSYVQRRSSQLSGFLRQSEVWKEAEVDEASQAEALARIAQGETLTAIARSYKVSQTTISRLAGVTFMQ